MCLIPDTGSPRIRHWARVISYTNVLETRSNFDKNPPDGDAQITYAIAEWINRVYSRAAVAIFTQLLYRIKIYYNAIIRVIRLSKSSHSTRITTIIKLNDRRRRLERVENIILLNYELAGPDYETESRGRTATNNNNIDGPNSTVAGTTL